MTHHSPLNRRYHSPLNNLLRAAFRVASRYGITPNFFL